MRLLGDDEAASVKQRAFEAFHYTPRAYWIPLAKSDYDQPTLFIMREDLASRQARIEKLYLGASGAGPLYLCLPYWRDERCYEIRGLDLDFLIRKFSVEYAVFDPKFRSILYVGHEGTVTFSGKLLLKVKDLLRPIRHAWNDYRGG